MQEYARLNRGTGRRMAGVFCRIMVATLMAAASVQAGTLYWGGGSVNITGPQVPPTELGSLSGTLNATLQNWALDTSGTSYQAWDNTGTSNTAYFGSGLASASASATIAINSSLTANQLDFRGSPVVTRSFTFTAASPVTLTLNGATPTVNLFNNSADWRVIFPANVAWAGSAGLNCTGKNGWLQIHGDASQLTGPIVQRATTSTADVC